ncbi:MAG: hypothetical protein HDT27_00245 [Subdoligranulum sp.]|nr:hypothetical protein [Subdoligranulum sp.]
MFLFITSDLIFLHNFRVCRNTQFTQVTVRCLRNAAVWGIIEEKKFDWQSNRPHDILPQGRGHAMPELKHTVKDSVFSYIFRQPENIRELYRALHPEDTDIKDEDCRLVTLENVLTSGMLNDLAVLVRNTLIILIEAQSTYSENISLRVFLYLAKTYKQYVKEHEYNLYGTKPVSIPRPELYMVYVGEPRVLPEELCLSTLYGGGEGDVEVKIRVLKDTGKKNIIDQYIRFCEICSDQRRIHGNSETAVKEILRICKEENVLMPFLMLREKEVQDIMVTLFYEEYIARMHERDLLNKGRQEEREKTLRRLITAMGWPLEQAMTFLEIPEPDRPIYRELLKNGNA